VSVHQISSIQDERTHILTALKEAQERADIVLITGGLGPTKDDITKKTIAEFFNDTDIVDYPEVTAFIKKMFAKYKIPYNEVQKYQSQLPSKATLLMNRLGTAPGMWFYENETVFVSMPGIPYEMKGLMKHHVLPRIIEKFNLPFIIHKTVMTYGQGESMIAERIEDWVNNLPEYIKLAYLPNYGRVRLRLSAKGPEKQVLEDALMENIEKLYEIIPDIITGMDEAGTIESYVGQLLKERNLTVCTAESLTGGRIASTIVSVSGASSYFKGSMVVYSKEMKEELLGIDGQLIDEFSVVSKEVAQQMAISARRKMNTDLAIAVTGNAGPTSDQTNAAVGIVYIAIASQTGVICEEFKFGQPREKVIKRTVNKSLQLLQSEILKNN
jgi:nicotinamide-nucleotide amidase